MAIVSGSKKLVSRLKNLAPEGKAKVTDAAMKSAEAMAAQMRALAPVKSGALRDSIKVRPGYRRNAQGKLEAAPAGLISVSVTAGDKDAFYALFVEFGTSPFESGGKFEGAANPGADAQPFFYPTWRAGRKKALARVKRALNRSLKTAPAD